MVGLVAAKRCSICAIDWPLMVAFNTCPKCEGTTWHCNEADALTPEQAQYKRKEIRFDEYYKERGEKPLTPVHAREVALTFAKADIQQQLELWLLDVLDDDPIVPA